MDGVNLRFTRDAVKAIARRAITLKTGARALRSIMESIMLEVMYDIPHREGIAEVVVDEGVVTGGKKPQIRKSTTKSVRKNAA
jgi:ATP-dependent Clp protease ATP-binding subunit ClpX